MDQPPFRNLFACLVHEKPDCIIDMVQNLRYLDPDSSIILYNGSKDPGLLKLPQLDQPEIYIYPNPQPMEWGTLHGFALDVMRHALDAIPFDTITIVDSDQLGLRPRYSQFLARALDGLENVGMLGNNPKVQGPLTTVPPAKTAHKEIDVWRPFLRRFPDGESNYVHWTFWPSTVFTRPAAQALVDLFDSDEQLAEILAQSKIWATEEIILPTLVKLLGFEVIANPCSYTYVKYRVRYSRPQLRRALHQENAFWMHPVPRDMRHTLRTSIRYYFNEYVKTPHKEKPKPFIEIPDKSTLTIPPGIISLRPILNEMKHIEGWFSGQEAMLLIAAIADLVGRETNPLPLVEIGSYCGRATVVMGRALEQLGSEARIYSIDPHDGKLGAQDQGLVIKPSSLTTLKENLNRCGLLDRVEIFQNQSDEVEWNQSVGLLLIDGLHDYAHVSKDFEHFSEWVVPGGYIAFHDFASYFPGVQQLVHEVIETGMYEQVRTAGTLTMLRKRAEIEPSVTGAEVKPAPEKQPVAVPEIVIASKEDTEPLVSCIMPTDNRRVFIPQAIRYFLRQDYPHRELLILDNGTDTISDLIPGDPRIRYSHIKGNHSIGALRNAACRLARGELIAHWDDDDWIADWRLSYQVAQLLEHKVDLCGLERPLFYDPLTQESWQYIYPSTGKKWVYGATFCYRKSMWLHKPFANVRQGEDTRFVWNKGRHTVLSLEDVTFYTGIIHTHNTSRKRTQGSRWHSYSTDSIRELIGQDVAFYDQLGEKKREQVSLSHSS